MGAIPTTAEGGDASSCFSFAAEAERGSLFSFCLVLFWKSLCLENAVTQERSQAVVGFVMVVRCSRTDSAVPGALCDGSSPPAGLGSSCGPGQEKLPAKLERDWPAGGLQQRQ